MKGKVREHWWSNGGRGDSDIGLETVTATGSSLVPGKKRGPLTRKRPEETRSLGWFETMTVSKIREKPNVFYALCWFVEGRKKCRDISWLWSPEKKKENE